MSNVDFSELTAYAKKFCSFTPDHEALLMEVGPQVKPLLPAVTEQFYGVLQAIPRAQPFLEGRTDSLKATHLAWMEGLFTGPYDESYAEKMYNVGVVHVNVELPSEFMAGAMALIQQGVLAGVEQVFAGDTRRYAEVMAAVTAVLGFSLLVMQQSYQEESLSAELDKFLKITGMSRVLFDNLATAYSN